MFRMMLDLKALSFSYSENSVNTLKVKYSSFINTSIFIFILSLDHFKRFLITFCIECSFSVLFSVFWKEVEQETGVCVDIDNTMKGEMRDNKSAGNKCTVSEDVLLPLLSQAHVLMYI